MNTISQTLFLLALVGIKTSVALPSGTDSIIVPASHTNSLLFRRAISADQLLKNGQRAQGLNLKYASLTTASTCQVGDMGCIEGGFAQCVNGKFVKLGCSPPTVCFELPLLLKPGSVPSCTTPADADARISNTGVKGGVKGDGTGSGTNTTTPAAPVNSTADAAPATSTDDDSQAKNGTSATPDMPDMMNSTAAAAPATSSDDDAQPDNVTDTGMMGMQMNMSTPATVDAPVAEDPTTTAPTDSSANATQPVDNSTVPSVSGTANSTAPSDLVSISSNATNLTESSTSNKTSAVPVSINSTEPSTTQTGGGAEEEDCVDEQ